MSTLRKLWDRARSAIPKEQTDVGSVAVLLGYATQADVDYALRKQKTTHRGKPFGAIMVECEALTPEQLREVLKTQKLMRGGKASDVMTGVLSQRLKAAGPAAVGIVAAAVGRQS